MSSSCGVSHESCRVCMCVRVCVRACVHACVRVCVEREPWYLEPVTSYLYVRGMARSSLLPITVYVSLLYVKTTVNVHTQRYSFTHINTPSSFHVDTRNHIDIHTHAYTHTRTHTHTTHIQHTHTHTPTHSQDILSLSHTAESMQQQSWHNAHKATPRDTIYNPTGLDDTPSRTLALFSSPRPFEQSRQTQNPAAKFLKPA